MPSNLLKCTICPKKPGFSDVSHLLTHVGSKGHLAHLHGLQVRSHEELDAGHQLAVYNLWFQEHGVAGLLSERLRQKRQKKTEKKVASQARENSTKSLKKSRSKKQDKSSLNCTRASAYDAQPPVLKSRNSDNSLDEYSLTPLRSVDSLRDTSYPDIPSSPPQSLTQALQTEPDDSLAENEPRPKASPGTPQLKGTKYPGMDLFDAAPEEQRKKRNQKKDSSVLRQLERNAIMVVPTEIVTSATGTILKHRHMDNLEDDELVEGEEMFRLPTPKRQKSSASHKPRLKQNAKKSVKASKRPRQLIQTPVKSTSYVESSLTQSTPCLSHVEDEALDSKPAIQIIERKKRKKHLVIYEDSSPSFGGDGASEPMSHIYTDSDSNRQQLSYPPPPWQRSQEELYDPFKLIRERFTSYASLGTLEQDKENIVPSCTNISSPSHVNPLLFAGGNGLLSVGGSLTASNHLNPIFSSEIDPFNDSSFPPMRNPLLPSFERLNTPARENVFSFAGIESTPFATHNQQPLFAP